MDPALQEMEPRDIRSTSQFLLDTFESDIRFLVCQIQSHQFRHWFRTVWRKSAGFFEILAGFLLLALFAQGKTKHEGPAGIGRIHLHQFPAGLNRLRPFFVAGIGSGKQIAGPGRLGLFLKESSHELDHRLIVTLPELDLGQPQTGFREIGLGAQDCLEIGFGLGDVPRLEIGQGKQVGHLGRLGLLLQNLLEVLYRFTALTFGKIQSAAHQEPFGIDRVFLEDGLQRLEAPVILAFTADQVGLSIEGGKIVRAFRRHFVQQLSGGVDLILAKVEVSKIDLCLSVFGCQINRGPEFLLGSIRILAGFKEFSHGQAPVTQARIERECFFESPLRFR